MKRTKATKAPKEGKAGGKKVLPVRIDQGEREALKDGAKRERRSLSSFVVAAALERAKPPPCGPGQPAADRCGPLVTTSRRETACYEVREAEALITSHKPDTWEPDPRYPRAVQERDYRGDANAPDPAILLAMTPTAVDGPPVVSEGGIVLGGNGRSMALRRAYRRGTADAYRRALIDRAATFGLPASAVEALEHPVLVRVVRGLDEAAGPELAAWSSVLNEGLGNSLDERARAVAQSRRLSPETLAALADLLEEHETLRAAAAAAGPRIVRRLEADGLITAQSRAALVESAGGLSEAGKQLLEGAFLGLAAGTPERLAQAAPATLQRAERLVPYLARVRARENGHDLIPVLQAALDLLHRAAAQKVSMAELASQQDAFSAPADPKAHELARLLSERSIRQVAAAGRAWAALADFDPRQPLLFGDHPTPAEAWKALMEGGK